MSPHPQSWRPLVELALAHAQAAWLRELDAILWRQRQFWMRESCDVGNFRLGVRARFRLLRLSRACQRNEELIQSLRQQAVYRKMSVAEAEAALDAMIGHLDALSNFETTPDGSLADAPVRSRQARVRAFEEFAGQRTAAVIRSPALYWIDKWLRTEQEQLLLRLELAELAERDRCLRQVLRKGRAWLHSALALGRFHEAVRVPPESPFLSTRRAVS